MTKTKTKTGMRAGNPVYTIPQHLVDKVRTDVMGDKDSEVYKAADEYARTEVYGLLKQIVGPGEAAKIIALPDEKFYDYDIANDYFIKYVSKLFIVAATGYTSPYHEES